MYQLFTPPWISTSRIGCRVEVVVPSRSTSHSRNTGRAPCQYCPKATFARSMLFRLSSQ